jgi:hypothetical protein
LVKIQSFFVVWKMERGVSNAVTAVFSADTFETEMADALRITYAAEKPLGSIPAALRAQVALYPTAPPGRKVLAGEMMTESAFSRLRT